MSKGNAPESEAFIGETRNKPAKTGCAAFLEFLYNKEEGTVLGRSPLSWLQITVFYIIFYAALVGFWAACLVIFLQTIDYKVPCWYGKGTIIGVNPGMGYQPWIEDTPESTLIHFNQSEPSSYQHYVDKLDKWFAKYSEHGNTRECTGDQNNRDENEKPCRVKADEIRGSKCKAGHYGYPDGQPCVIITLNRLIGWMPVPYPKDSEPAEIRERYNQKDVPIFCDGEYFADRENMGPIEYFPPEGLREKFFPYRVAENYHQPFALAKFANIRRGVVVEVECKAYAYNIVHDRNDRQGMVHFEVLVDSKPSS